MTIMMTIRSFVCNAYIYHIQHQYDQYSLLFCGHPLGGRSNISSLSIRPSIPCLSHAMTMPSGHLRDWESCGSQLFRSSVSRMFF